jgi:hypothetical protein
MTSIRRVMDFEVRAGFDVPSNRAPPRADEEVPTDGAAALSLVVSEFFMRLLFEL